MRNAISHPGTRLLSGLLLIVSITGAAAASAQTRLDLIPPSEMFRGAADSEVGRAQALRLETLRNRNDEVHRLLGAQHISRRGLNSLSRRGLGPAFFKAGADPLKRVDTPDTLRILLIRVGFETDRSGDLTSVTEDGDFLLVADDSTFYEYPVDTPPHDADFFRDHLNGLAEYYRFQSGGRLIIESSILPLANTRSYKLSDLADYGPGEGKPWTIDLLETLVVDMINLADDETQADGSVNLSDYAHETENTYVIFVHAGGDWQSDVFADSPNDIPTFFVSLGDSIPLDRGGSLRECSVIPESTSQDGYLGSIAGALYHEFGHSLGLPDVYDTGSGLPRVGYWDLMDSGPNLVSGFFIYDPAFPGDRDHLMDIYVAGAMPPSLSAWCRWYLGWLDVGLITGGESFYKLPASQIPRADYARWYSGTANNGRSFDFNPADPQILIGGTSPRDFFLIENRWVPKLDWSDIPDRTGVGPVFSENNVILFMGGDPTDLANPTEYRNTGYYDWFQPGGGLLVWHVNREQIEAGLEDNTINMGGMGLRLVEADGLQDVGVFSGYPLGIMGSATDPFHAGTSETLPTDGRPSTHTYDGARSGFHMSAISAERPTMRFRAGVAPLTDASPLRPLNGEGFEPRLLETGSLTPVKLTRLGVETQALFFTDVPDSLGEDLWLYCIDHLGNPLLTPADPTWPSGAVAKLSAPLAGPPILDTDATGGPELLIGTQDGLITSYGLVSTDGSLPLRFGPVDLGEPLIFGLVLTRTAFAVRHITASLDGGRLRTLDTDGVFLGPAFMPNMVPGSSVLPSVGDFVSPPRVMASDSGDLIVLFGEDGWALHEPAVPGTWLMSAYTGGVPVSTAILPSSDTQRRVVTIDQAGVLNAVTLEAPSIAGLWSRQLLGAPLGEPAVADLDGDGRHDLIVLTAERLYALDADGHPLTGYPLDLLAQYPLSPDLAFLPGLTVFDASGDGVPEIFCNSSEGHLFAFDAGGSLLEGLPLLWGDRSAGVPVVGPGSDQGRVLWLTDRGGRASLGDYGATQVDGRIIGYLPNTLANAGETAEWLGPQGGADRRGSAGDATALTIASGLIAAEERFFAYPNPARGDLVTFRSHPVVDGRFRVAVYNLEGELVEALETNVTGGAVGEIEWSLDGRASGLYLCRLETPVSGGVEKHLMTLAVER